MMADDGDSEDSESREAQLIRKLTRPELQQPTRPKTKEDEELIRLALHQSPFFTCLDEEQVARFVKAAQLKTYHPGEVVILEGYMDDDMKDGDGDKLDTKGLLKRLLSFEKHDTATDTDAGTDVTMPEAITTPPVDVVTEQADSLMTDSLHEEATEPMLPMDVQSDGLVGAEDDNDDELFHDEHDEMYASLDAIDPPKRNERPNREDHRNIDPTESENYGGMEADEMVPGEKVEPTQEPDESALRMSGIASYVYTVRSGSADVWHGNVNMASLGKGTVFGEGGFLFHRQHSATIMASESGDDLECWVVPAKVFRNYVLPSENMIRMFSKYAMHTDEYGNPYMTMDEFVKSCLDREGNDQDPIARLRMANTYKLLRKPDGIQKINLANYCLFHLLMSRPDPEVDIAFLLLDRDRTGTITLENLSSFLDTQDRQFFNLDCDFVKRHFGPDGKRTIRPTHVSQFLVDFQQEMGRQAFLHAVQVNGTPEGYLNPNDFVQVLKTACGWRLPQGISDRLENLYCKAPIEAAEAGALMSIKAEHLKGSSPAEVTRSTTASILANIERRSKRLGDRCYAYGDFLAFQEVLQQLPGICNLIHGACEIKKGPVSADDFKVANLVIGLGGKLSRRQVEIIFQLFDLDHDGFVSGEDTVTVMGTDFIYKLEATAGREGKLTFAPPPDYRHQSLGKQVQEPESDEEVTLVEYTRNYLRQLGTGAAAGFVGGVAGCFLAPLDLVKTRMQLQLIAPDGTRMYANTIDCFRQAYRGEGFVGLYRGTLPYLLGVAPQRAFQLTVYSQICKTWEYTDEETGEVTVPLSFQVLAGGVGGGCKVLFGNPLEIIKIELQTEGESNRLIRARGGQIPPALSFPEVARELGFGGYYRGAASCLWRDIPYSAIFFPLYSAIKKILPTIDEYPSHEIGDAFCAGVAAAIPAAISTTPADVIKTRLQAAAAARDTIPYTGMRQCAVSMFQKEGLGAFFKGAGLRALKSGPQLGLTMAAYEHFSTSFGVGRKQSPASTSNSSDYRRAFPIRAYGTKAEDIDGLLQNMGIAKPSDTHEKKQP
jgi:solute carrier family 25 aspartate/glutamate transporter 12/13